MARTMPNLLPGLWALPVGLLLTNLGKGWCLNMLTSPQLYNTGVGESVTLSCEFRAAHFDLFNNPLLWTKTQRHENTQVNIQSNVNAPFWKTKRFRVKYIPSEPIYRFELTITDLRREDNGNYTCEVRGQNSRVLANVTHLVMVRAPVESMFVSDGNGTAAESLPELVYTSTRPGTLRCVAEGAYPAPDLQLSVSILDVGRNLASKYTPLFEGPVGLRRMSYTVERWSHQFYALPQYDGHELLCAAIVPGLTVHTVSVKIRVLYPPIIQCNEVSARLGMRNVSLTCVVTSRPRATGIRWFIDHNGTHFDVLLSTAFWASQKVLNSTSLQATLHLSHTGRRRFRPYTILAKNAVGKTSQKVELLRNYAVPTVTKAPKEITTAKTARLGESGSHYIFIMSGDAHAHTFHLQWTILILAIGFWVYVEPLEAFGAEGR